MKPTRLLPLLDWSERRIEGAGQRLGQEQRRAQDQQQRLQDLQRYRQDYQLAPLPADPRLLANRALFLGRLEQAVQAQHQFVGQAQQRAEQARQDYLLRQRESERLQWLQARARGQAQREQEHRQQLELEERHSQRMAPR
ncbi:MAG TPA: flagellar export protein FliJ [Nevskiaceae bacterium]|nr:flagellar export protein FliJ [Nevskiaceae bacterium]